LVQGFVVDRVGKRRLGQIGHFVHPGSPERLDNVLTRKVH
jgi:hypothetical protein